MRGKQIECLPVDLTILLRAVLRRAVSDFKLRSSMVTRFPPNASCTKNNFSM